MKAYLVAGLAYGDEGKGATVDYLVRSRGARLVVRYNGGAQAVHNVITEDGRHHPFSQFGSGTFVPGVKTHLSRFMIVNPVTMMNEEAGLQKVGVKDAWDRTTIDEDCLIVTPYHQALCRLMEWSRKYPHGTTGMGIGQCRSDHLEYGRNVLFCGDLCDENKTRNKLEFIRSKALFGSWYLEKKRFYQDMDKVEAEFNIIQDYQIMERILADYRRFREQAHIVHAHHLKRLMHGITTVFEGAQGFLLDEFYGEKDHNTWSNCSFKNVYELIHSFGPMEITRVGVLRSYLTRHGAGQFEDDPEINFPEPHNPDAVMAGKFKRCRMDFRKIEYSLRHIGGVDWFALNHLDHCPEVPEQIASRVKIFGSGPSWVDRDEITFTKKVSA